MELKYVFFVIFSLFLSQVNGEKSGCPFSKHVKQHVADHYEDALKLKDDPDPETTTPNGCTCLPGQYCGATLDGGNYLYDWCYTNEGCGEHSAIYGWWDKCLYVASSQPDYLKLTWQEKQDLLWTDITADNSIGEYHLPTVVATESVITVFDDEWDVMPAGRVKAIHGVGGICPFVVKIAESPFTGLLKAGELHGFMRMASGNDPMSFLQPGMTPGTSIKFLRTGRPSVNYVAIQSASPIPNGNYNFFAVPLTTHTPQINNPAAIKFCQASSCPEKIGISDLSKYDQDGNEVEEPVFAFKISHEPADVNFPEEKPVDLQSWVKLFDDISIGTALYTLKAHENPDDVDGHVLGQFVTTDKCVSSHFGDTRLFFRHQRIEEDKEQSPEWADAFDANCCPFC